MFDYDSSQLFTFSWKDDRDREGLACALTPGSAESRKAPVRERGKETLEGEEE